MFFHFNVENEFILTTRIPDILVLFSTWQKIFKKSNMDAK